MKSYSRPSGSGMRGVRGLMLMECLVYLGVWMVVAGVAFGLFYQVYTKSKHLSRGVDEILQAVKAGECWRADVRASRVPARWEPRGENRGWDFFLETAAGTIVYRFTGTNILRRAAVDPRWREVLGRVETSAIERDEGLHGVSWRWELELYSGSRRPVAPPRFTFQAVPGMETGT